MENGLGGLRMVRCGQKQITKTARWMVSTFGSMTMVRQGKRNTSKTVILEFFCNRVFLGF